MTHTSLPSCRVVEREDSPRNLTGVEARWALVESGTGVELVIEFDLDTGRCRLLRASSGEGGSEVLREGLIDCTSVCLETGADGLRAVTVPGVMMVVEGTELEGVYARSPWLDALGARPGCLELVSLRIF